MQHSSIVNSQAWHLHENKRELEMLDPKLTSFNKEEATRVISVALLCTQASLMLRPPMSRVVAMLVGDIEVSEVTMKPSYLTDWNDLSSSFASHFFSGTSTQRSADNQVSMPSNESTAPEICSEASPSQLQMGETVSEGR